MMRILFLRNDSIDSAESFIDTAHFEDTPQGLNKAVVGAGKWIAEKHNEGEKWTAEVVQVIFKLERVSGAENVKNESANATETKK